MIFMYHIIIYDHLLCSISSFMIICCVSFSVINDADIVIHDHVVAVSQVAGAR